MNCETKNCRGKQQMIYKGRYICELCYEKIAIEESNIKVQKKPKKVI